MNSASGIESDTFFLESNGNLGALEIFTFISMILFGMSISQGYTYFKRNGGDRLFLKTFVSLLMLFEVFHTFTAGHSIYYDTVTRWNRAEANSYPISVNVLFESIITFAVQCFFSQRIFKLSDRIMLSGACFTLSTLRFIGGVALSVESILDVARTPNGIVVHTFSWLITSSLTLGAAADILIAASMIYYLRKMVTPHNLKSTTETLNRLVRWSLQTGLITSMLSVTIIICFQSMSNMVWYGLYIILAKLYSISLLVSLNARPQKDSFYEGGASTTLNFEQFPVAPISISFEVTSDAQSDWDVPSKGWA